MQACKQLHNTDMTFEHEQKRAVDDTVSLMTTVLLSVAECCSISQIIYRGGARHYC